MANPKHILKPTTPAQKALTDEEKAAQVARFFTQKREQLFQLILANAMQSAHIVPARQGFKEETMEDFVQYDFRPFIDASLVAADYALEKLYPIPAEGDKK